MRLKRLKINEKRKKFFKKVSASILMSAVSFKYASANALKNSPLVQGTFKLVQDGTEALLWIVPAITIILIIWNFSKMQRVDEDVETTAIKKKIRLILYCGIGAFLVSGLFNLILGYYVN